MTIASHTLVLQCSWAIQHACSTVEIALLNIQILKNKTNYTRTNTTNHRNNCNYIHKNEIQCNSETLRSYTHPPTHTKYAKAKRICCGGYSLQQSPKLLIWIYEGQKVREGRLRDGVGRGRQGGEGWGLGMGWVTSLTCGGKVKSSEYRRGVCCMRV